MITYYLTRTHFAAAYTLGRLTTPKQTFWTLEDAVREQAGVPVSQWKIPGETAIPKGTYPLILDMSNRFGKIMPHILNVEGFSGIRIHSGNSEHDTEGCILLGWGVTKDGRLEQSRIAVDDFMAELEGYYDVGASVQIEIS